MKRVTVQVQQVDSASIRTGGATLVPWAEEDPGAMALYRDRVRACLASWLTHDYVGKAITDSEDNTVHGAQTGGLKTVFQYGNHGYIKAALGDFHYAQAADVTDSDGTVYAGCRVMEMDCCTFASLITKGYSFDDSIYKDAVLLPEVNGAIRLFNTTELAKALQQATAPYRPDRNSYLGLDGNNNITTDEWAETLYYSGCRFARYASQTYGQAPAISRSAVSGLQTGDLVFWGSGSEGRSEQFYGIHHVGVYVKSLAELEAFADGYRFRLSDTGEEERYSDARDGYIVHVYNSGAPKKWVNVLRIDTMAWAARQCREEDGWQQIWTVTVAPNTLNVSGGMEASTSWRNSWGKAILTNWHDTNHYFTVRTSNGGAHGSSFGACGLLVYNHCDFNTMLESGLYRFTVDSTANPLSSNLHMPVYTFGYLEVVNPVTDRFVEDGTDRAFATVQTFTSIQDTRMRVYRRWTGVHSNVSGVDYTRKWTSWYLMWDSNDAVATGTEQAVAPMAKKYF